MYYTANLDGYQLSPGTALGCNGYAKWLYWDVWCNWSIYSTIWKHTIHGVKYIFLVLKKIQCIQINKCQNRGFCSSICSLQLFIFFFCKSCLSDCMKHFTDRSDQIIQKKLFTVNKTTFCGSFVFGFEWK